MGTTRPMRTTSCAASLTRSRTRCGIARTGWNRRTWPTGWPSAAGNWPRASWSTSPTSLTSWAARPASAPSAQHQAVRYSDDDRHVQDVELGFDGDRPERPVGAAHGAAVLPEQAVPDDDQGG